VIWTRKYDSGTGKVDLGAADWWSYFDHRKVLPTLPGSIGPYSIADLATTYMQVDQNEIARQLVAQAQAHTGGDIGIQVDTSLSGILRDRTYFGYSLSDVGEMLRQLSGVDGGPDIMFDTTGPDGVTGLPVRLLRIGNPLIGQQGSPHVVEYGANLVAYSWASDASKMATRSYATGEGSELGTQTAAVEDTTLYEWGWPLLEAAVSYSTVTEFATLAGHAIEDQRVARLPVALMTAVITGDLVGAIGPGDDCRVRIRDQFFSGSGLDTRMRCVGITLSAPDEMDSAALTLAPITDDIA
jgi:hypothetical protein